MVKNWVNKKLGVEEYLKNSIKLYRYQNKTYQIKLKFSLRVKFCDKNLLNS